MFVAGDVVAVDVGNTGVHSCHRVTRVMKRFVELSDGSRWAPNGCGRYPRRQFDMDRIGLLDGDTKAEVDKNRANIVIWHAYAHRRCYSDDAIVKAAEILRAGRIVTGDS